MVDIDNVIAPRVRDVAPRRIRAGKLAVAVAAALLLPAKVYALGLGEFHLLSPLGQPLVAEIDLISADAAAVEGHCFRLSPGSDVDTGYPWLRQGRVTLERSNGRARLVLRTLDPIWEPVLEIGIEVGCGGSLTRRYTALPELPEVVTLPAAAPATPATSGAVAVASVQPAVPAAAEKPTRVIPKHTVARTKVVSRPAHKAADHLSLGAMEAVVPPPRAASRATRQSDEDLRETIRSEAESLAEAKTHIQELEQQLATLVSQSRQMQEQLRQVRPTTVVSAPPTPAPEPWPVGTSLFGLGFVSLAGGAAFLLRRRARTNDDAIEAQDDVTDYGRDVEVLPPVRHMDQVPVAPAPSIAEPVPSEPVHMDVEDAVVELADVLASLGMGERAVETLSSFAEANPKHALNPWLRLLRLYRRNGQRGPFDALAERVASGYNIDAISWDKFELSDTTATLERYGHIIERLTANWGNSSCVDYLKNLLTDSRDGTRTGFPVDVAEEMLLLTGILKQRLGAS